MNALFCFIVTAIIHICGSMPGTPRANQQTAISMMNVMDLDAIRSRAEHRPSIKRVLSPHEANSVRINITFNATADDTEGIIQRISSEMFPSAKPDLLYIKNNLTNEVFELKKPQHILVFGGAFCPPHKKHFENIEKVYDYYDHIIIAIQDDAEERHGFTIETIKTIWSMYLQLLPDGAQKIAFLDAAVDSNTEPFMFGFKYALKQMRYIFMDGITDCRIDILMGPDNKGTIIKHKWDEWIGSALVKYVGSLLPLALRKDKEKRDECEEWLDERGALLDWSFVIPIAQDSMFHATYFVDIIMPRNNTEAKMNFLPKRLPSNEKLKVLDILKATQTNAAIPFAKEHQRSRTDNVAREGMTA